MKREQLDLYKKQREELLRNFSTEDREVLEKRLNIIDRSSLIAEEERSFAPKNP